MPNQDNRDNRNDKDDLNQDSRQRTGQPGGVGKQPPKGAPTAGNRDANEGKLPTDKGMVADDHDVEVGDDRTPQRTPQGGPGKPGMNRP